MWVSNLLCLLLLIFKVHINVNIFTLNLNVVVLVNRIWRWMKVKVKLCEIEFLHLGNHQNTDDYLNVRIEQNTELCGLYKYTKSTRDACSKSARN